MPTVTCVKKNVKVGGVSYPMYVGFLPAAEIATIAEAPSFARTTPHQALAAKVLQPPMDDWQRPLDGERVDSITNTFNGHELMPNPVLLAQNAFLPKPPIMPTQVVLASGIMSESWHVDINAGSMGEKPLWILDGQHRIAGLSQSAQKANPVPIVLLLNDATTTYSPAMLAKIFAQVTTSASKLDELHNEWLTYAFRLGDYSNADPTNLAHVSAMTATAELCNRGSLSIAGTQLANPFLNKIRFNHYLPVAGFAFDYNCIELKELIHKNYFRHPADPSIGHLQPIELAAEIANAYEALVKHVSGPHAESVFFGSELYRQRILQDAFLVGIMTRLLHVPRPHDWNLLLHNLRFSTTPWNFNSWKVSLNGPQQTASRDLALRVFATVFRNGTLPQGANSLADFLRGNNARVKLIFSKVGASGRVLQVGRRERIETRGAATSDNIAPLNHVRVTADSENVARIRVVDRQSPPGRPLLYSEMLKARGMTLNVADHPSPLRLDIRLEHYAGTESSIEFDITW